MSPHDAPDVSTTPVSLERRVGSTIATLFVPLLVVQVVLTLTSMASGTRLSVLQEVIVLLFTLAYTAITAEHKLGVSKSAVALIVGAGLWLLLALTGHHVGEEVRHVGGEVFEIVAFLLAAMGLVEILVHYEFFDVVQRALAARGLTKRGTFAVIATLAFLFSAVLDNLTTTIVMVQIARRFFRDDDLVRITAAIVIAANAGGAFSPIGDVTTIMLWLSGKFETFQVVLWGFLPSLALFAIPLLLLLPKHGDVTELVREEPTTALRLGRSEWLVIALVFVSFSLPLLVGLLGFPPYLGLIFGLGVVWIVIDALKVIHPKPTHLDASIENLIKRVDIPSLKFFIGILLAVAALGSVGILDLLSGALYGALPSAGRIIGGNIILGLASAVLDNVPLTAMAITLLQTTDQHLWVLLALAVGTGGSLLVVGSAAGVVAMGMVKELTFVRYLRTATLPALLGFAVGMAVWGVQYALLG